MSIPGLSGKSPAIVNYNKNGLRDIDETWQPRGVDRNEQACTVTTSLYQSAGAVVPLSEHVNCVAVTFKMTEQVEQQLCIRFCNKLEHSSVETIWMIQKAAAMGNW